MGSTLAARRAGSQQASRAVAISAIVAPAIMVAVPLAESPGRALARNRASQMAPREANGGAYEDQPHAGANNQPGNLPEAGPQGYPDANLGGAVGDEPRDDAVDERGEEQAKSGEANQQVIDRRDILYAALDGNRAPASVP